MKTISTKPYYGNFLQFRSHVVNLFFLESKYSTWTECDQMVREDDEIVQYFFDKYNDPFSAARCAKKLLLKKKHERG